MLGTFDDVGLGVLDITSRVDTSKRTGNIILQSPKFKIPIVGFINSQIRTETSKPLGTIRGTNEVEGERGMPGNTGTD